MANYANAKATIAANIYTNHRGEVTAESVKTAANEIVDTLIAGGYLYAGVAKLTPTQTNPGSPDANVFYIATEPGTYTNFVGAGGSLVVAEGEVAIFKFNGTWSKEVTGAATAAQVTELGQYINDDRLNLLFGAKRRQGYYYTDSYRVSGEYNVFEVPVVSGQTYYISQFRYISKQGELIQGLNLEERFAYTADFTGTLYITFAVYLPGWVVSTVEENETLQIRPFDTPSLMKNAFSVLSKLSERRAFSQMGTVQRLCNYFNQYNLLYVSTLVRGKYHDGNPNTSANYDYYAISVVSGRSYTISPRVRMISKDGTRLENYTSGTSSDITYTPDFTGTLYVTFFKNSDIRYMCETTNAAQCGVFEDFMLADSLGESTRIPVSQKALSNALSAVRDKLYNKKWVACGDSFTHGDFSGLADPADYIFQDEPYMGKYMVYPYFIGRRTLANIVNEAVNGSTMAYINGSRSEFSTPNGRYTQIPADADYITLYFGINDSHQHVPIGTIDDSVNTTFYGAWNIVMEYLIRHHPNAKIGIIISNGCDSIDYPNAEIAIAKKWGVAYLDLNSDYKVPMVYRVNGKPDLSDTVKGIRNAQYRVAAENGHPNAACHEDESHFIEAWIKSI